MRNLKILILATLFALLFSKTAIAQTLTVIPPDSLLVCNENTFQLTVNNAGGNNTLSIAASVNTPACPGTVTCLNEQLTYFTVVSPAGVTATFNPGTQQWDIYPVSSGVTVQLTVRLDCGLLRPCITPGSTNIELTQTYYLNGNVINTTNNGTPSLSQSISYPYLIDETAPTFNSSYLNTVTVLHKYRNTGLADAVIEFKFTPYSENTCTADSLISMEYATGNANTPNALNYTGWNAGWNAVTVQRDSALFIRKQIFIKGCTDAANGCNQIKDSLIWRCQQNPVCDTCLQVMDKSYALNNSGTKIITLTRITPANNLSDSSCMGASLNWEYRIRNTGNVNLASAVIEFFCNESDFAGQLQLIDSGSVQLIAHNNTAWSIDTTLRFYNVLCSAAIPVPLKRINIRLADFMAGDSVTFKFTTYRCCDEADTLFNMMKKFGNWRFRITGTDICNSSITINHNVNNDPVWMTTMDYYETVSNLTNPPFTVFGPSTPVLYADIKTPALAFAPVYQLAGCQGPCPLKGFLRVTIASDTGLVVDTPLVHILNAPFQTPDTLWPVYWYKTIPDSACEAGEWHFYFDMTNASANITSLLLNGRIGFRLRSCCMAKAITDYSISLAMLPAPRSNCFTLGLTDTTHTVPPACLQGNCCFLPLARAGGKISVKCPGCLAPGLELTSYSINRISLGRKDSQNNFLADLPVEPVDSAYLAVYEPFMHTRSASFSDLLIDRMTGHFQDGDSSGGGYSYQQMLNAGGVLNVLQLQRLFSPDVNYPVNLQVQRFRLYIDKPDTVNQCIDCAAFTSDTNGYRTVHIIEVTGNDLVNYLNYNGNNHFYTFDARAGQNLFDHVIYSHPIFPFTAFAPGQRYRLSALYSVCSRYGPNDYNTQSLPDQKRTVEIVNFMFLSGEVHTENEIMTTLGDMPNTAAGAASLGFTSYNQHFADTFAFVCARTNGRVYLLGDEIQNWSFYRFEQNDSCQKFVLLDLVSRTAGQKAETVYPYEYKGPSLTPWRTAVFIPQGYTAAAQAQVRSSFFLQTGAWFGNWLSFPVTQTIDSVIIHSDSIFNVHPLSCLTDTASIYNRLYLSDNMLALTIRIPLIQAQCLSDSVFHPSLNSITTLFTRDTLACFTPSSADCQADSIRFKPGVTDSLFTVKPELSVYLNPPQSASGQPQVCWTVKARNLNHRPGSFFYLSVPPVPWFSNWSLTYNGNTLTPVNGVFQIDPVLSQSLDVTMMLCAQYDSCTGSDSLPLHFGWNCNGFPQSYFDYSACFIDSVYFHWIDQPAGSQTAHDYPSAVNLCDPVTITGFLYATGTQILIPLSLQLNGMAGYTLQSVQLTSCLNPDTVSLPVTQPYHWTIDTLSLFDDSLFYAGNCLKALVTLQKNCDMSLQPGDTLLLPVIQFGFTTFCNNEDTLYAQARTQPASPLDYKAVYTGISNCTNCFSITKIPSTDTIATGDTITYSIILCANNDSAYSVTLHELLPANFVMTSGQQQQTVSLPQQGCDTLTVSGYFTTPGNCMDNINTVLLINSQNDTLSADTCVTVMFPCWQSGILEIPDNAVSSTYGSMISNDTVIVKGTFYISNDFTFKNCLVYMAGGAKIELLPPPHYGILTLDSTVIQGCDTMWYGIELLKESILWATHSELRDAERAVIAGDSSFVYADSCLFADNIISIYTPSNAYGGLNTTALFFIRNRFGMESSSLKTPYINQQIYGATPYAGIVVFDTPLSLNLYENDNRFFNMNMGISGFRSFMNIKYCRFDNIQPDASYGNPYDGSAIVSLGKYNSVPSRLWAGRYQRNDTTMFNCYTGVYTDFSMFDVRDIKMINMHRGVYGTRTHFGLTGYAGNLFIEAEERGIEWYDNIGTGSMKAEANIIKVDNDNAIGIELTENSAAAGSNYTVTQNNITVRSGLYGIAGTLTNNAKLHYNHVAFDNALSGIIMNAAERCSLSCNTSRSYDASDTTKIGIEINQSSNTWMSCNTVDSTGWGIAFSSSCAGTVLRANIFNNHYQGLRLDGSAIIDPQQLKGNKWLGTYGSGFGAVNWNSNNQITVSFNEFTVQDSLPGTVYHPYNFVICSGCQWFVYQPGTPDRCTGQFACNAQLTPGDPAEELSDVDYRIAEDSLSAAEYEEETKRMAEQYLFDKLNENDSLRQADQVFEDFHSAKQTMETGLVNKINGSIQNIFNPVSTLKVIIEINNMSLDSLYQMIFENTEAFYTGTVDHEQLMIANNDLIRDINLLLNENDSLLTIQSSQLELWADSLNYFNNQIQANETVYQNEKTVNEIYRVYLLNRDSVTTAQRQTLTAIAEQCPKAGGEAVYKSRSVLKCFNGSMVYNDRTTCSQQGYNREAASQKMTKALALIKPNPAKETITLIHQLDVKAGTNFVITDVLNRILFTSVLPEGKQEAEFNVSNLSNGFYLFRVICDKETLAHGKFAVSR
ncbi:MAG: T9SS type A sorting domain-containing protein [Bacteroidia bacterium]|nr:T9SS type A sorting domain-containing protein [Bacteroidia bacterium]